VSRDVTLIEAPYHLGVEGLAAGAGPRRLLDAGADNALGRRGRPAQVQHVRMWDARSRDLDAVVDVNRLIARAVREAVEQESLPVVLAGNCNSCLGTLAGLGGGEGTGVVWFDAHGDFNTPSTSPSGLLEGMSLAAAVGLCHDDLRVRTALHDPVAGRDVLLLGARDLDPGEGDRLAASQVTVRPPGRLEDVPELLVALRLRAQRVYLHFDVDVLDPGGIPPARAEELLSEAMRTLPVAAAAVTNYNPQLDESGNTQRAILSLLRCFSA
jgi:arginase